MSASYTVRSYTLDDYDQLLRIQRECFPPPFPQELLWTRAQIAGQVFRFPEGALCVLDGDDLVGSATCNRLILDDAHDHTWAEAADDGHLRNFDPGGDTLYGIDVAVRPAWRGRGVARMLYQARFDLVRRFGMRRFLAGSRLSGYHLHREQLTPEQYAAEVAAGRLIDPVITPQLKAGLRPVRPVRVVRGYIADSEAADCALLMEWTP